MVALLAGITNHRVGPTSLAIVIFGVVVVIIVAHAVALKKLFVCHSSPLHCPSRVFAGQNAEKGLHKMTRQTVPEKSNLSVAQQVTRFAACVPFQLTATWDRQLRVALFAIGLSELFRYVGTVRACGSRRKLKWKASIVAIVNNPIFNFT